MQGCLKHLVAAYRYLLMLSVPYHLIRHHGFGISICSVLWITLCQVAKLFAKSQAGYLKCDVKLSKHKFWQPPSIKACSSWFSPCLIYNLSERLSVESSESLSSLQVSYCIQVLPFSFSVRGTNTARGATPEKI